MSVKQISYGVMTDERKEFGREVLSVWSPPFASTYEASAVQLPKGDGYMLTTYNGDKVRVTCPTPRTEANYRQIDKALSDALNAHYEAAGYVTVGA